MGVGLKLRGVRLEVKLSFVNVHHGKEQSLSGCSFEVESLYECRDIHKLACINHRAASCMTVEGISLRRCFVKGPFNSIAYASFFFLCILVDIIQTGHKFQFN